MASYFTDTVKNSMLDGLEPDKISLHNGNPGTAGTSNEITGGGYARVAATFDAAAAGVRALSSQVDFSGPASDPVSWFGVWDDTVFLGAGQITEGDTSFNSEGEFALTTDTELRIDNVT